MWPTSLLSTTGGILPPLQQSVVARYYECPLIGIVDTAIPKGFGGLFRIINQYTDVITSLYQIGDRHGASFANIVASKSTFSEGRNI